jgi:hypothetical protein
MRQTLSQNVGHSLGQEDVITFVHGTYNTKTGKYGNMWGAALCLRYQNVKCSAPEPPGSILSGERGEFIPGMRSYTETKHEVSLPQGEMVTQIKTAPTW